MELLIVLLNESVCPQGKGLCALMVEHLQAVHNFDTALVCLVAKSTCAVVGGDKHKLATGWKGQVLLEIALGHEGQNAIGMGDIGGQIVLFCEDVCFFRCAVDNLHWAFAK